MTAHILLTGASRGIGAAIADTLTKAGARVFAASSRDADLESADGPALLWDKALSALEGRIDVLVNNAGVFEASALDQAEGDWLADWRRTMAINLDASALLCRLAVLHFQARGRGNADVGGRIVNVASRAAHRGDSPAHWHYAASKGAMVAMTKTIARAYAKEGIYAFAVSPGFTRTGMAEEYLASRGGPALLADIPLGRVAEPEEIGRIVTFLALDAPPSMTGATIDANGASYVR